MPIPGDTKAARIFEHGKISYIDEIKTLYQFENVQGIVQIFTHFQENNTAYLVMEYLDGCNLKAYVKSHGGQPRSAFGRELYCESGPGAATSARRPYFAPGH